MNEKSFSKITVKDICTTAGINRSTFYLHYSNQFNLIDSIEEEIIEEVNDYIEEIVKDRDIDYLTELLTYISENRLTFRAFMCNVDTLSFQEEYLKMTLSNLNLDLELNCDQSTKNYIFGFLTSGCQNIMKRWLELDTSTPPGELAQLILDLCNGSTEMYRK
jgi:AcrR family transcriptional regulator